MGKQNWKAGNMLYPVPAVMVSCKAKSDKISGDNKNNGNGLHLCQGWMKQKSSLIPDGIL